MRWTPQRRRKPLCQFVRAAVYARASRRCEFCGLPSTPLMNIHHRWYPEEDTPENLMCVHRLCHEAIHFGRKIRARADSLAARGDRGKGNTEQWRKFLTA